MGHGSSCRCLTSELLGSVVPICGDGGGDGGKYWLCGGDGDRL
jgi:hypothetical protein